MVWVSWLEQVPRRRFYACNEFWEWHYFSGFKKEAEGNDYALFFGTDSMGCRNRRCHGFLELHRLEQQP